MGTRLYVGNLPFDTTASELESLFQAHGSVNEASVVEDRDTGRSRGFGFVEMSNSEEANQAIEALNGSDFHGRPLTVNEARPRTEGGGGRGGDRGRAGGDRGGRSGGGYGGGRGR